MLEREKLENAFAEWYRRWTDEPERFASEATMIIRETSNTYGEKAADYLLAILNGEV